MLYQYKSKLTIKKPRTYCRCIGVDNKEYIIRADALESGATLHIKGAMNQKTFVDISGQRFGHLVALYPSDNRASIGGVIWHCLCDCINYCDVTLNNFERGHTRSCGCNNRSKYEEFIHDYLSSLHIYFEEEKRFSDCRNSKGSDMLPFDFYIPEQNILIEYDGQHHFEPIKGRCVEEKFK